MALTSILLPVYNGADYIRESIESVLAQDSDFELLIQDDASKDSTREICKEFADSRINYALNEKNLGCFGSLNAAAARATGSLLRIFSHDDLMMPGDLRHAEQCLKNNPDYGIVISNYEKIDSQGRLTGSSLRIRELQENLPDHISGGEAAWYLFKLGCISGTQSTITIRRSLFEAIGGFNTAMRFCGDFDFLARSAPKGGLVYNRRVTAQIRFHTQQTSKDGRRHTAYLDEMHEVLQSLLRQMEISRRIEAIREFDKIYGQQFFDLGLKRLLRGDGRFLVRFLKNDGPVVVAGSCFAWFCGLRRRYKGQERGRNGDFSEDF